MIMLVLCFIFSISVVSASGDIANDKSVDNNTTYSDISPDSSKISKNMLDFDFLNIFGGKKYAYWVWASDMYNVDLDKLSSNGVKYIFLNSFAFTEYGQKDVLDWIKKANDKGIEVHVWMQIFNTGDWISPLKNGTPDNSYFNYKIEEGRYYAGLEGVSGIQIDYIRFEGNAYNYENGTEAISLFVKNFAHEMRKANPDLTLSATVMPEKEKDIYFYGQDAKEISKHVDIIFPMIYKGNYNQSSEWIKDTTKWFVENSEGAEVWSGIQTYKSDDNLTALPNEEMKKDTDYCFEGGAKGVSFFRWGINKELENNGIK